MNRLLKILLLLLFISVESCAIDSPGARQAALSLSNISSNNDLFSVFNNPAGLGLVKKSEIGFFYSPAPFDVKELSNAYAVFCEPTSYGSFSGGLSIYGFELYKETKFIFGYSNKIGENFIVGGAAIYKNISIKNYGTKGVLSFNFGGIANVTEQIGLGFVIENATRSTLGNESNQIPTIFIGGVHFKPNKDFTFSGAIKKELGFNPSIRLGTEYSMLDFIQFRFGASNEPNNYSGGFGIVFQFLQIDYAITSHTDLGLTHQFGSIIRFGK